MGGRAAVSEFFYAPNFGEVEGAYWFRPVCPYVRNTLAAEKLKKTFMLES